MMKIKLFYNKEPYQNILTKQEHGVDVWNDLPNNINDSSFYKILNILKTKVFLNITKIF